MVGKGIRYVFDPFSHTLGGIFSFQYPQLSSEKDKAVSSCWMWSHIRITKELVVDKCSGTVVLLLCN